MDALVSYADEIGLWLILDHHRTDAGNGAKRARSLVHQAYPESVWIDNLTMLASRYAASSSVVGHRSPQRAARPGHLGRRLGHDWRLAAERAGNAVLAANPESADHRGGDRAGLVRQLLVGRQPLERRRFSRAAELADRLVYSPHDYPASVYEQPYFADPDYPANLPDVWDATGAICFASGSHLSCSVSLAASWRPPAIGPGSRSMIDYLGGDFDGDGSSDLAAGEQGISWTYWSWNPNSGDTGGILADDWSTPVDEKLSELTAVQFPLGSHDPGADVGTQVGRAATFTIQLDRAYDREVTLSYVTQAGTATAGVDFTSQLGRVTFAPGQTSRQVSVLVISDAAVETNETFSLQVAAMAPAVGEMVTASATILDDDLSIPEGATPPVADPSSPPAAPPPASDPPPAAPPADVPPESLAAGVVAIERSRWHDGLVVDLEITAPRAVDDWRLSFEFDGEIVNIWNATIVSRDGSRYTIAPLDYTASLAAGQTIVVGFQGAGIDSSLPSGFA